MKKVSIAMDVDGTLRCNCTEDCQDPNTDMVLLFGLLAEMKNTDMYVWSGGGADYARRFAHMYALNVKDSHCIGKNLVGGTRGGWLFNPPLTPDIAIDDIQECQLGTVNLIAREK